MDRRFEGRSRATNRGCRSAVLLACVAIALTLGVVGQAADSPPSFARLTQYAIGGAPLEDVAISDLNGDGKLDLAVSNENSSVYVLLNSGEGKFKSRRAFRTGPDPAAMAVGDLNGDRKPDLVTANLGSDEDGKTVSVLLNLGGGALAPRRDYETGRLPQSVATGDLNGDGKPDLAVATVESVTVLLNAGDGAFASRRDWQTGASPTSVAIGDLNGDSKPDLAITDDEADTVSVRLNSGDAIFETRHDYRTGEQPVSVAVVDLNGDSKPDVVTVNATGETASVLANGGDGTLRTRRDYRVGASPGSVTIFDLNGDRKPDLATANSDGGTVSVLTNRGDGTFFGRRNYGAGDGPLKLASGDLNGDGKPELAITDGEADHSTLSVLRNATGLCAVPNLTRKMLPVATKEIAGAGCRLGKIRRVYSKVVKPGRVISQRPRAGAVLMKGAKINLVVSLGRMR
jgi:FG-GAP-like repeat/PASTA domain